MEKKGFLLLVALFVVVAAACATTSSPPSLTASGPPKDDQSASAAATGTTDDRYDVLIGEWRGRFNAGVANLVGGRDEYFWWGVTLMIHEIDIANARARCTISISGDIPLIVAQYLPRKGFRQTSMDNSVQADFIPRPTPKIKWEIRSGRGQYEFVLKDKVLEGTMSGEGYNTAENDTFIKPPHTVKMEKRVKK